MARREYQAGQPTTLVNPLSIGGNTFTIALTGTLLSGWPDGAEGYNFWVTVDGGTPQEERILCSSRTGSVVTIATAGRGADGTQESNHTAGATVWPSWSATDADEANAHINASSGVHGLGSGVAVVGTSNAQELENKTLVQPKINEAVNLTATSTELNILDGAVISTAELNYLDGVTSAVQTQLDARVLEVNGAVTTADTTQGVVRNIFLSTSSTPSGGIDGDVWLTYIP